MEQNDKNLFLQMLTKAMGAYGKPLPDAGIIAAWIDVLNPYPLSIIGMAFAAYCDENGEFAPVPAGIAKRCKVMDGRPGPEEAWAIALTSRDEADTVVWTAEAAEAFALCLSVLDTGDEVGARMAFKEAYSRIVAQARNECRPAQWSASLGWDVSKREAAMARAHTAGLLAAPVMHALLPNHADSSGESNDAYPEGLKRLKEEMAKMQDVWALNAERRSAEIATEREAIVQRKNEIALQVAAHEKKVGQSTKVES